MSSPERTVSRRLADAVTGPRGRWLVIAVWLALGIAGWLGHGKIGEVTAAGQSSFLPSNSESTRAIEALETGGGNGAGAGEEVPTVIVFERDGGLTEDDLNGIGRIGDQLNQLEITGATPIVDPFSADSSESLGEVASRAKGVGPLSRDGEAALVVLALDAGDRGAITKGVTRLRQYLAAHAIPGVSSYVTGPGGIAADLEQVAEEASETLLVATLSLVLILLLLVYRAPPLALLPLLVVGVAYLVATGVAYLLIEAGWITVNSEGTMLLLVLIFGAGTDYSLLLVHRYREEIHHAGTPPGEALPKALAETMPAIAASAGTVVAAMLVLLVADLESTHWLGPILALGIATMLVAAFTLLPALLAVLGPHAFWPRGQATPRRDPARPSVWRRVAAMVERRSRLLIAAITAGLLVLALGNFSDHGTIGFGQGETKPTNSSEGTEVLEEHFPPGLSSPLAAVVAAPQTDRVARGIERMRGRVELTLPVPTETGKSVVVIVIRGDPYSGEAAADVEAIRERLHEIDPSGLLGGIPAENFDIEQTNARDTKLIVPLVLLVVALILCAVLRALLAPLFLILTVVLSFAATLGLCTFLFSELSSEGTAFNLVLMAFIFLVALGVDYNIFLMTRAREEATRRPTREATMVALVNTGGVVTGAGVILAGTFATLILLPLEELEQIGATVALGVLLDTFLVRALLIPSIVLRLGPKTWWPARAAGDGANTHTD
ncbi:MAG: putative drug exporter of the superfamily [Solirubrobacterales bacterium]|nr:putative drug exporter of the superfamily [Solirubrobacterales bacterium]